MKESFLKGLGVALATPFKSDKSVDYDSLERLINHIIKGKANYIVVLGTTGESSTLFEEEKLRIKEFVKKVTNSRVPLIVGFGGNNTGAIIKELENSDLSGFSGILSVVPYYNKPNQKGLYHHFEAISKSSPLPVILYNIPGRTGVNLTAETTLRLADNFENVVGIKEASGNFQQIEEIIKNKPSGFEVISGDDAITLPLMKMGAAGVISVIGNAFPEEFGKLVSYCQLSQFDTASKINESFMPLIKLLFEDGNPAGIKYLLSALGLIENELRLPLVSIGETTSRKINNFLNNLSS